MATNAGKPNRGKKFAQPTGENLLKELQEAIELCETGAADEKLNKLPSSVKDSLISALDEHTLAVFIGADLPRAVTGQPSRDDLARELARRKSLNESLSLAKVAAQVSRAGNRSDFTSFILNQLDSTNKSPQPFHHRIVSLVQTHTIKTLITTAYDNLLELAFREARSGVNRVVTGTNSRFINDEYPTLLKLYGDIQQPETLVVTDSDHSALLQDQNKKELLDDVRFSLRRNTVVFIGYDLTDPAFHLLFDQIAESRFARTAYAVWSGLPETDIQMWRDRGIVIIDANPLEVLDELGTHEEPLEILNRPTIAWERVSEALIATATQLEAWGNQLQIIKKSPDVATVEEAAEGLYQLLPLLRKLKNWLKTKEEEYWDTLLNGIALAEKNYLSSSARSALSAYLSQYRNQQVVVPETEELRFKASDAIIVFAEELKDAVQQVDEQED